MNKDNTPHLTLKTYLRKYKCNKEWLLALCSTFDKDMDIFNRNYRPPLPVNDVGYRANAPMVSNADNFFSNLAPLRANEKSKAGSTAMFLSKAERLEQKKMRLIAQ